MAETEGGGVMSEMVNRAAQAASDAVLKNHQILMDNVAHTIARAVIEAIRDAFLAEHLVAKYNFAPECLARLFAEALR